PAAVKWMKNIGDEKARDAAFDSMVVEWAGNDPAAAAAFAMAIPDETGVEARMNFRGETEKQHALAVIAQEWSNKDPRAAMNWVPQLAPTQQHLILTAAQTWASSNPQEAA